MFLCRKKNGTPPPPPPPPPQSHKPMGNTAVHIHILCKHKLLRLCSPQILFQAFNQKPIQNNPMTSGRFNWKCSEANSFTGFGLQKHVIPAALYCHKIILFSVFQTRRNTFDGSSGDDVGSRRLPELRSVSDAFP